MKLLAILILFVSTVALAEGPGLYYAQGDLYGSKVETSTFIGYYDMCFYGKHEVALAKLWDLIKDDSEKLKPFATYYHKDNYIVYGYADTKCMDEGETYLACRSVMTISECD